jgi:hypothetical protein
MRRSRLASIQLPLFADPRRAERHRGESGTLLKSLRYLRTNSVQRSIRWPTTKDPNQKQPGEKEPGKYHYNPGNMSEKTIDSGKPESQQRANVDRIKSRGKQPQSRDNDE